MPRDIYKPIDTAPKTVIPTNNPVEMAKRLLDVDDTKYQGWYNAIDDSYIIEVIQRTPISDIIFSRIKMLGFRATGRRIFYYKRYSSIRDRTMHEVTRHIPIY